MNKEINQLASLRTQANISLNDVAYLMNIDTGNLSKIEKGIRKPNVRVILLYHILFDAPLIQLFTEEFKTLKNLIKRQSQKLITQLEIEQPPKSNNRIQYIQEFIKSLNSPQYEV